jgi:quercetin dioxygenase-like cupin family protein
MSTLYRPYRSGELFGAVYTLEHKGDGLPEHAHTREMEHNVVVLRGSISLFLPGAKLTFTEGALVDFDGSKPHRIVALEPQTKILNLYLYGIPSQYAALPESEFIGQFDAQ